MGSVYMGKMYGVAFCMYVCEQNCVQMCTFIVCVHLDVHACGSSHVRLFATTWM